MKKEWIKNESLPQMLEEMHEEICIKICKYNELIENAKTMEEEAELQKKYCSGCCTIWLI